jgi:predicted DNA-binding transcriptional regulator AlpA
MRFVAVRRRSIATPKREGRRAFGPERNQMAHQKALPPTLAPRLISRAAAAAYINVSPTTFDEMVKDGRMPRPKRLGGRRKAWDVRALDAAVDQLPVEDNDNDNDTWDNFDAA